MKLVKSLDEARAYFTQVQDAVVVQPYHPGPFEAGVFYYRFPDREHGQVFSITDKHFPVLTGDGVATIADLIWTDPRYRLQGATFAARHAEVLARVLSAGERFGLTMAGNHAQGTLFRDGSHLLTPALERRIDEIAQSYPGFCIGRFDIRYADVGAFMEGRDLAIVELNGATGESTNIYDPAFSLLDAYRILFRQWRLVFAIGAANRAAGATVSSTRRLIALVRAHAAAHAPFPVSD